MEIDLNLADIKIVGVFELRLAGKIETRRKEYIIYCE